MIQRQQSEQHVAKLLSRLNKAARHSLGTLLNEAKDEDDPLVQQFRDIERKIQGMKDLILTVKRWEGTVVERCRRLEQEMDDDIFKDRENSDEIQNKLLLIDGGVESLKKLVSVVEVLQRGEEEDLRSSRRALSLRQQSAPPELLQAEYQSKNSVPSEWYNFEERVFADHEVISSLQSSYEGLETSQLKACCLFLSVFPEKSIIRKRSLIYWWIGEGLVSETPEKAAAEVGEDIFRQLLNEGFLRPISENGSPVVNRCSVHPLIRHFLATTAENGELFYFGSTSKTPFDGFRRRFLVGTDNTTVSRHQSSDSTENNHLDGRSAAAASRPAAWRRCWFPSAGVTANDRESSRKLDRAENVLSVFNINLDRLDLTSDWFSRLKMVEVLQLGRWQDSPKHHIEIKDEDSLSGLGPQKHLKYVSLQGISRVTTLPESITKLISLEILDLRACHNLEKLPDDISSLRNLTHLDMSECYLLDSMPKGLEHLTALQVLKGFLIGSARKNPCTVSDLSELKRLRKLSIRIQDQEAAETREFADFANFVSLKILVISWAVVDPKKLAERESSFSLPPSLQKLDLRCVPLVKPPKWLKPHGLRSLEKLYIRGGEFESLPQPSDACQWNVRILRLKYLKNLHVDEPELRLTFPEAIYMEKIKCKKTGENPYDPDIIWHKTEEVENRIVPPAPAAEVMSSSSTNVNKGGIRRIQRFLSSFKIVNS